MKDYKDILTEAEAPKKAFGREQYEETTVKNITATQKELAKILKTKSYEKVKSQTELMIFNNKLFDLVEFAKNKGLI